MNKHNPIDLDIENNIIDKPFYKWLEANKPQTLAPALLKYFDADSVALAGQFSGTYEIYKAIYDTFWSNYYRD